MSPVSGPMKAQAFDVQNTATVKTGQYTFHSVRLSNGKEEKINKKQF